MKRALAVALGLGLGIALLGRAAEDAVTAGNDSADLVFVDVKRLYRGRNEYQPQVDAIQELIAATHRETSAMLRKVEDLRADPDDPQAIKREMDAIATRMKAHYELRGQEVRAAEHRMMNEFYDELLAVLAEYARQRGVCVVCRSYHLSPAKPEGEPNTPREAMTQRIAQTVLYSAHKPADVTEEILVRLNGSAESAEPPSAEPPAKAAVVDVAKLFAAHRNLNRRLNDLKVEVAALEEQFAKQEDEIMRMQAARDEGEPEARPSIEKKLSDSEAEMAAVGRRLEAQEARIYEEAYDELLADVARYARRHDLRVVYRKLEPASPKQAGESNVSNATLQRMNRPVVYVRVEPTDITPAILDHWAQSEESARGK